MSRSGRIGTGCSMKNDADFVVANGERREVKLPSTVADFVLLCGFKPTQIVVEHNGRVLTRSELWRVALNCGDNLELIVPVAGG